MSDDALSRRYAPHGGDESAPLRLAVIGSPRSGNTWVRWLLSELYGLEHVPAHFPYEIDWDALPTRCVIQIHWYPTDDFLELMERHGVQVVVPARHPFDVLMSWLNHNYYKHADRICPGNGACPECKIAGLVPRSEAFIRYARSDGGRDLLCYSPAWWDRPGVVRVRYEDLVAAPGEALDRVVRQLGRATRVCVPEAIATHALQGMRKNPEVWRFHCWQGQPGLWKKFLTAEAAREIADGVPEPFDIMGYACDPDEALTPFEADLNWATVQLDSTRDQFERERMRYRHAAAELAALRDDMTRVRKVLQEERAAGDEARRALEESAARLAALRLRPWALHVPQPLPPGGPGMFERLAARAGRLARRVVRPSNPNPAPAPGAHLLPSPHLAVGAGSEAARDAAHA